ncbi:MAG: UDP-N-acetylmuramate dehydrogenase [Bacteroidales bacterium]|nr:UDP-N-acetylmuramate dehydrogenase [Bacteroidales bacterium]
MIIRKNISLKPFNTFGLDYKAATLICTTTERDAKQLFRSEAGLNQPLLILGGGSNILFTEDFRGTILSPCFLNIRVDKLEKEHVIVSAGAGVEWDSFVEWCVAMGFSGIENLSGIPGSVGAVPVQNIGAYGVEAKETIVKVRCISIPEGRVKLFSNKECGFGYRTSIFKTTLKGQYIITRVYFRLGLKFIPRLGYGSLKQEAEGSGKPTLKRVRNAVLKIRNSKLPDPEVTGNAGSFFKNPVVSGSFADILKKDYPGLPLYEDTSGGIKVAAGWLIEQCGWKGKRIGDAGVHSHQALVLVNHGRASGMEIYKLSEKIRESVKKKFGINLEREVEVTGII